MGGVCQASSLAAFRVVLGHNTRVTEELGLVTRWPIYAASPTKVLVSGL